MLRMNKFVVLRVREDDEVVNLLQLSLAQLHRRLLRDGILVDDDQLDDKCLNTIQDAGIVYGPDRSGLRDKCVG